jgi:protein ImuA
MLQSRDMPPTRTGLSRSQIIERLRSQMDRREEARGPTGQTPISSGSDALDRLLPDRGFRRGTLIEWLVPADGSGAETMALTTAREACREQGALVVLDPAGEFYPPPCARLGIDLARLIVVQAANPKDNTWALDQALRCAAVAAVLAWPEKLDGRAFRRLQLAAEQGGGLGLLIRPQRVEREPSWAEARLLVNPLPAPISAAGRWLRVQVLSCRGGGSGGSVEVEIDDETCTVHLAPRLVHSADRRRAAGAS